MRPLAGITAFAFNGKGSVRTIASKDLDTGLLSSEDIAFTWVHLNRTDPHAVNWLNCSGVNGLVVEALTAEELAPGAPCMRVVHC